MANIDPENNEILYRKFRETVLSALSAVYTKISRHGLDARNLSGRDMMQMFLVSLQGRSRQRFKSPY